MSIYNKVQFNKKESKKFKLLFKYLPSFFKGFLIIMIGILVLSLTYYKTSDHSIVINYISYLFLLLGGFISGNSTHKKVGGMGIITGTLGALPVALFTYILLIIFTFESLSFYSLLCPLICIVGGTIGGVISSNTKKRY